LAFELCLEHCDDRGASDIVGGGEDLGAAELGFVVAGGRAECDEVGVGVDLDIGGADVSDPARGFEGM
jgi:hypothetical protein